MKIPDDKLREILRPYFNAAELGDIMQRCEEAAGAVDRRRPGLTRKQRQTLDFIAGYVGEHGCSPSFNEIAASIKVSSRSSVFRLTEALIDRGYLQKLPNRPRSLAVVP